jgi:tetratricopeptide (TPR) repeat protein
LGYNELAAIGLENFMDQVDEGNAEIWALLGEAYGKLGRIEDAQSAYARAIQLSDDVTVALIGRGLFYLRAERYQEALDDLAQAVENGTRSPDVLLGYGQAAYALGDYQTAIDSAETVLEDNPENVDAIILAALAASEVDLDAEDTVALVNDAFNSGAPLTLEQQALLYEARARALYQLERYNEARNDMEQALFVAETGTRHYYNALIRAQQGEIEQAILELEWVKALDASYHYPFSAELDQHLEDLYQQRETGTGS